MSAKRLLGLAVVCALSGGVLGAPADAGIGPGSFERHRFEASDDAFSRDYWTYVPKQRRVGRVPLVVYLHGCAQDAHDAAIGSRWNELAERQGFVVAYPEQALGSDEVDTTIRSLEGSANGARCWNWFRPENQVRGSGEAATITGITRQVIRSHRIDPGAVFVLGGSAGANMATTMGATYPDLYAAIGSLLGCPYLECSDHSGAAAFDAMGAHERRLPVFVVDGTADTLNPFPSSQAVVEQWLGTNDFVDNGLPDGSVSREPTSIDHRGVDESMSGGLGTIGDTCVRPMQWPCPGGLIGAQSYPHSVFTYSDSAGPLVEFWLIHGLSHNYPNGDPSGHFTDPHGPDINRAAYDFFLAHRRGKGR